MEAIHVENEKQKVKLAGMVAKYKTLRATGYNHAAAAHATITGIRGTSRKVLVDAFLAVEEIAAESKKFAASVEI